MLGPGYPVRNADLGAMVSLDSLDACYSACLPANLIQAQRDYSGLRTYERIDVTDAFHMHWETR